MTIIYISGIDGCGKTTQAKLLVDILIKNGINAEYMWLRWEPTLKKLLNFTRVLAIKNNSNGIGLKEKENIQYNKWTNIKKKVLSNIIPRKLWLFYACNDYYYSCKRKIHNVDAELIVLDRYIYDFIIDQAINLNISHRDCFALIQNKKLSKFKFPDLNIILDIPSNIAYQRKMNGTSINHLKVRGAYYQNMFNSENTVHFDGTESLPSLKKKILNCVNSFLREGF